MKALITLAALCGLAAVVWSLSATQEDQYKLFRDSMRFDDGQSLRDKYAPALQTSSAFDGWVGMSSGVSHSAYIPPPNTSDKYSR